MRNNLLRVCSLRGSSYPPLPHPPPAQPRLSVPQKCPLEPQVCPIKTKRSTAKGRVFVEGESAF